MATRFLSQTEHDEVVAAVAQHYRRQGLAASTNPSQAHNFHFSGLYPDVKIELAGGKCYLFEIETADSVSDAEAAQWAEYGRSFPFHMVVPEASAQKARDLVSRHRVQNVWIHTYRHSPGGGCVFSVLPQPGR